MVTVSATLKRVIGHCKLYNKSPVCTDKITVTSRVKRAKAAINRVKRVRDVELQCQLHHLRRGKQQFQAHAAETVSSRQVTDYGAKRRKRQEELFS